MVPFQITGYYFSCAESWKFGDCASTVATQLFFHGTPMLCSSVHTTGYKFNRSVTVVTVTVLTSLMLYNNLLHDILSHDRTWFCQTSKYRTSGFPWQAEFDTCNAKPFQLLLHVCNGTTGSSVLLHTSCVKFLKKKSAFQITRLCFHQNCNYSNSYSTREHNNVIISSLL